MPSACCPGTFLKTEALRLFRLTQADAVLIMKQKPTQTSHPQHGAQSGARYLVISGSHDPASHEQATWERGQRLPPITWEPHAPEKGAECCPARARGGRGSQVAWRKASKPLLLPRLRQPGQQRTFHFELHPPRLPRVRGKCQFRPVSTEALRWVRALPTRVQSDLSVYPPAITASLCSRESSVLGGGLCTSVRRTKGQGEQGFATGHGQPGLLPRRTPGVRLTGCGGGVPP